ncbi:type II secretion system protein [Planomicrobium sp. Y74]|uniref:PulJ/GspJ family protein n=1 Tax=Planomicrobium sp. Y74 TaxID=2478977 RepID=UPI000EF48950|nr:type II secretion system protein [Planomicrobium sp. Y74]RLQ91977.1 type II secretion system protein [Planomicrobium sp. Y74]
MRKCSGSNEKGLTLVEVLAALVILGILFVGIMTIFPQMTLFNEKTEAKLDTMNLARQEMAAITAQDKWKKIIELNPADPLTNVPEFLDETKIEIQMAALSYTKITSPPPPAGIMRFEKDDTYLYQADIYLQCETFLNTALIGTETPPAGSCERAEREKLYKVHLKLYKSVPSSSNYQLSSETFSYITYKAVNETP